MPPVLTSLAAAADEGYDLAFTPSDGVLGRALRALPLRPVHRGRGACEGALVSFRHAENQKLCSSGLTRRNFGEVEARSHRAA